MRWLWIALPLGLLACEETIIQSTAKPRSKDGGLAASVAGDAGADAAMLVPDFQEVEFSESDKSRDPFRSYSDLLQEEAAPAMRSQRDVLLEDYAIDELKLLGIVTRVEPRAMLVDPTGKGHVVRRGQFVGRPEIVQPPGAGSTTYQVNWRVDRIRENDIVLVREDPKNPDVPTATKVIPLRPEDGLAARP